MNALLVNPHKLIPSSFSITLKACPPLGLAYIASALEHEGFGVRVYDCLAEAPENYFPFDGFDGISVLGIGIEEMFASLEGEYDLIGVSVMFSNNWLINRHLINLLKKRFPTALIVVGGEHASSIPQYCLNDSEGADIIVVGEGEETIGEIAACLKDGRSFWGIEGIAYRDEENRVVINNKRKRIRKIGEIIRPAWHLLPTNQYFDNKMSLGMSRGNSLPILATRGCPYECTFCSSPSMWGTKYSMRDVSDVIGEIKWLYTSYDVRNIDFYDLTAIISKRWILDFCKELKKENLQISWQIPGGTRTEVIDYEVAIALKNAGCVNITYAPESGSEAILKSVKKKVVIENMLASIEESHRAGLNIKLNIILGYPQEKVSDIFKTILFLIKASYRGVVDASPSVFSPYPGSALFDELQANNELTLSDDYFKSIVFSQSLHHFINYNRNYSKPTLILLLFLSYLSFYSSNYLFRPIRFFRLILNVYTKKYETRGEYMLGEILKRRNAIN